MTEEEFMAEGGRVFEQESSPTYTGSNIRGFNQEQKQKLLKGMWLIKSITDKLGIREKLVNELVRRSFDCEQDRVDFILKFLA